MVTTSDTTSEGTEAAGRVARAKPELLAPAGDQDCLIAAVENGADAVYFGLQRHNARARATNFADADLAEVMTGLHRRGVRGYLTLNTLVFPRELPEVEENVRRLVEAGVDAVIVQDLGLARLIRALTREMEIHASTQMSVTSEEGIGLARDLGCSRVILARELSLREIAQVNRSQTLPVEVFVHGALCVAYSGQCLTSEALGGRSANRGECAQACRMPYELVCDGAVRDLGDVQYLLSPRDLAAHDLVPALMELGVTSLKIEGRLKSPEYVANVTRHYRRAIDEAWQGRPVHFEAVEIRELELSFSRGFSHGFLDGNLHKALVRGDYSKKRGIFLGRVSDVSRQGIRIDLRAPVKKGDGLVLDGDEAAGLPEQGGRVYAVRRASSADSAVDQDEVDGPADLHFGRHDVDLSRVRPGQRVWKTDDPELTRRLRKTFQGPSRRLVELDLSVTARTGHPLVIVGSTSLGASARVESQEPLERADRLAADEALIREQLARLGGSAYRLRDLRVETEGGPMVPKSLLNALRRDLVARLDVLAAERRPRTMTREPVLPSLKAGLDVAIAAEKRPSTTPALYALCRTIPQIEAAVASGVALIYADFQEVKRYDKAVAAARLGKAAIFLATPRIEKPGEANLFRVLARQGGDGLLVRNAGGLAFCAEQGIPFVADFSLNAANELTVDLLRSRNALRVTASYDLNAEQLVDLINAVPKDWLEVVIHQQIPMFHMEFCAFSAHLSNGKPDPECGRPCDRHDVKLRDRAGVDHPLKADVGCRNTLFNATPQTAAEYLPTFLARGVRHLRVEFLDDSPNDVERTLTLYRDALEGRRETRDLWRALRATGKYGVTRGPLNVL